MSEPYQPLAGVTILAWEQAVSLPMATRLLADLGATVIRVDAATRAAARPRYLANDLVRNKLSIALDLRNEQGQALFRRLVRQADVVVENYTPRVKRQFGLTYDELVKEQPDLIMLSLSGYGQTGRWSERPTYGPGIESAAGHAQSTGYPEEPPTRPGTVVYADNISGFYAALAILAALHRRRATGHGARIDLAMYEALAHHLLLPLARSSLTGAPEPRRANHDPAAVLQDVYPTGEPERWVAVTVRAGQEAALRHLLNGEAGAAAADTALRHWLAARTAGQAAALLQGAGIAAAPVSHARDVLNDPQLLHRGAFTLVPHDAPLGGHPAHPHGASPFRFGDAPRPPLREAPAAGQDTRRVLRRWLGMDDTAIDALIAAGVAGEPSAPPPAVLRKQPPEFLARMRQWQLIAGVDAEPCWPALPPAPMRPAEPGAAERSAAGGHALAPAPRILDITTTIAGRFCAYLLGLSGSTVTRVAVPTAAPDEAPGYPLEVLDTGKAAAPAGADLMALARAADVLVEDGALAALGLTEARLRAAAPSLTLTRISEWGQDGPYAGRQGSELVNLAAGGMLFLTGQHHRPPVQLAPFQAQMTSGLLAAVATRAALLGGGGVTVDLSKQEAVSALVTPALTEYAYTGVIPAREGAVAGMTRIERAADRWVYAGPSAPGIADYKAMAALLGIPELAEPRFATQEDRMANWEEHQSLIVPRLQERTAAAWVDAAAAARLTFGHVQTTTELLACPVLAERRFFGPVATAQGTATIPRGPYLVDGARGAGDEVAPPATLTHGPQGANP